ncbi:unnamed protein product [Alternaria alternata]
MASTSADQIRPEGNHSLSTPVRFLILSDTHGAKLPENLPPCDVLLHCGDLTEDGTPESISLALQHLGKVKANLKLVISGNHEISLDKSYWLSQGGEEADAERALGMVSPKASSEASENGITFLWEGTYTFTLACGATFRIYASPYTPVYGTSAFQYHSKEDRFNSAGTPSWAQNVGTETSTIPNNVDIVMTHGPARYILDEIDGHRPSNALSTRSYSTSLISSRLFSQQTGTAIATELLYRILIDIINRFLCSFQRLASRGIDEASSWMERKLQERRDNLNAAKASAREGLKIVEEVGKLVEDRGFLTCPMTGHAMDATAEGKRELPGPPQWIRGVLAGIDEGRMVERDFWIHTHTG